MIDLLFLVNQYLYTLKFRFLAIKTTYFIKFSIEKTKTKLKLNIFNFLSNMLSIITILFKLPILSFYLFKFIIFSLIIYL